MKKSGTIMLSFLLLTLSPSRTLAHTPGQPPFFQVNGKYADFYPVLNAYGSSVQLPQDLAPEPYMINSPITFHIDTDKLLIPLAVVNDTSFAWDFGDHQKGSGLTQTHSYTTPGSYTLSIIATYKTSDPQLFQTMMLHVLPDKNYILPKAVIMVDGKEITDPLIDSVTFKKNQRMVFDASKSTFENGIAVTYLWDFGKDTEATADATPNTKPGKIVSYQYSPMRLLAYPRLRVTDANGFISDAAVQLLSEKYSIDSQNTTPVQIQKKSPSVLSIFIITNAVLLVGAGMYVLIKVFKKKKSSNR